MDLRSAIVVALHVWETGEYVIKIKKKLSKLSNKQVCTQ
jgi:hypothetical protein